jgi:hypothetical protein
MSLYPLDPGQFEEISPDAKYQWSVVVPDHLRFSGRFSCDLLEMVQSHFWDKACTEDELLDCQYEKAFELAKTLRFDNFDLLCKWVSDYGMVKVMYEARDRVGSYDDLINAFEEERWIAHDEQLYVPLMATIIDNFLEIVEFDYKKEKEVQALEEARREAYRAERAREREEEKFKELALEERERAYRLARIRKNQAFREFQALYEDFKDFDKEFAEFKIAKKEAEKAKKDMSKKV